MGGVDFLCFFLFFLDLRARSVPLRGGEEIQFAPISFSICKMGELAVSSQAGGGCEDHGSGWEGPSWGGFIRWIRDFTSGIITSPHADRGRRSGAWVSGEPDFKSQLLPLPAARLWATARLRTPVAWSVKWEPRLRGRAAPSCEAGAGAGEAAAAGRAQARDAVGGRGGPRGSPRSACRGLLVPRPEHPRVAPGEAGELGWGG